MHVAYCVLPRCHTSILRSLFPPTVGKRFIRRCFHICLHRRLLYPMRLASSSFPCLRAGRLSTLVAMGKGFGHITDRESRFGRPWSLGIQCGRRPVPSAHSVPTQCPLSAHYSAHSVPTAYLWGFHGSHVIRKFGDSLSDFRITRIPRKTHKYAVGTEWAL